MIKSESVDNHLRQKIIGRFLKEKREGAGLTQYEVARALRYSTPQFISNWERGVSLPPLTTFPKLSSLYQVQPKEMMATLDKYQEQVLVQQKKFLLRLFKDAPR